MLARLRCQRAAIDQSAGRDTVIYPASAALWVYRHLNARLRERLEPYLDLLAMRQLILALRYTLAGEAPAAGLFNHSLLAAQLVQILTRQESTDAKVSRLETSLATNYPFSKGAAETYRKQGPGGLELQFSSGMLEHALGRANQNVIKLTLRYLIDMRNLLMINKLWRWQVKRPPPITAGGNLAATSLLNIWLSGDRERLARLTARLTGASLRSTAILGIEKGLLLGLSRLLRKAGRDPLNMAVIVEYLWKQQLAAHDQLLRQLLPAERKNLLEEVLLL